MAERKGSAQDIIKIRQLEKDRAEKLQQIEEMRKKIQSDNSVTLTSMEQKFKSDSSALEAQFKQATVGLVSAEEYARKRLELEKQQEEDQRRDEAAKAKAQKKKEDKRKHALSMLSFDVEDDDDFDFPQKNKKKKTEKAADTNLAASPGSTTSIESGNDSSVPASAEEARPVTLSKDPTADTSFLPDRSREEQERIERARLAEEWDLAQARLRAEKIEVVYSYWDGSGHRRSVAVERGWTVEQFLGKCRQDLADAFREVRALGPEQLMYVKEDVIIPHHYCFHDLIVTRARGKSGPLFHFGVHEDVRLQSDARIEKDESHAGKVITRQWYERNKHVFPANRWEVYDPKKDYGKYTIG